MQQATRFHRHVSGNMLKSAWASGRCLCGFLVSTIFFAADSVSTCIRLQISATSTSCCAVRKLRILRTSSGRVSKSRSMCVLPVTAVLATFFSASGVTFPFSSSPPPPPPPPLRFVAVVCMFFDCHFALSPLPLLPRLRHAIVSRRVAWSVSRPPTTNYIIVLVDLLFISTMY